MENLINDVSRLLVWLFCILLACCDNFFFLNQGKEDFRCTFFSNRSPLITMEFKYPFGSGSSSPAPAPPKKKRRRG